MSTGSALIEALRQEFGPDTERPVLLYTEPPANIDAPAVVVTPGDPFLEPGTHGLITERWNVIAAVQSKERSVSVTQLRELSLRIRQAAMTVGAVWQHATGPRVPQGENPPNQIRSINVIEFRTQPNP